MNETTLTMTDQMKKTLDGFFAAKTINDVDRSTFLVCNLDDNRFKIKISIVFMRDWDSIESDSYNSVIIEEKGAVFTFPCYWISIPKELAMSYFEYVINNFYDTEVSAWKVAEGYNNSNSSGNTNNDQNCNNQKPTNSQPPCSYIAQNI